MVYLPPTWDLLSDGNFNSQLLENLSNYTLSFVFPYCMVSLAGPDKLSKPVATQKWDRIKLVCTQPFNKVLKLFLVYLNYKLFLNMFQQWH